MLLLCCFREEAAIGRKYAFFSSMGMFLSIFIFIFVFQMRFFGIFNVLGCETLLMGCFVLGWCFFNDEVFVLECQENFWIT